MITEDHFIWHLFSIDLAYRELMEIETTPIPKRLSDNQEVSRFLDLCERFKKENEREMYKEYASMALSRLKDRNSQTSEEAPNLVASQGSRPFTISIRLSGTRDRGTSSQPQQSQSSTHKVNQTPSYRHLSSKLTRVACSRYLSTYINKLKVKRDSLLKEYNKLRDESMSSFPLLPDPIRRKCHYDYFLEESVLMANDFLEERKWKIQVAYILAHEAQAFFYRYIEPRRSMRVAASSDVLPSEAEDPLNEQMELQKQEELQDEKRHKEVSRIIAGMVTDFWQHVHEARIESSNTSAVIPKNNPSPRYVKSVYNRGNQFPSPAEEKKPITELYQQKPMKLPSYLAYCASHKIDSVVSGLEGSFIMEACLFQLFGELGKTDDSFILAPENISGMIDFLLPLRLPSHSYNKELHNNLVIYHVLRFHSQPSTTSCLVFTSVLQQDSSLVKSYLTRCFPHYCIIDSTQRLPPWAEGLLLSQSPDAAHVNHELFVQATCTVIDPLSHNTTRTHRSVKDQAEGGEIILPIELETVPINEMQRKLAYGLIDAFQDILPAKTGNAANGGGVENELDIANQTLYAFFLMHSKVEIPAGSWRGQSCDLPPLQITWPRWLWCVMYPSPYESVLTSPLNIMNYCMFRLRHREILVVLAGPHRRLQFHHSFEIPAVKVDSIMESLSASPLTLPLLTLSPKEAEIPAIRNWSWARARTGCVELVGSDLRYKWLSHNEANRQERQLKVLQRLLSCDFSDPESEVGPAFSKGFSNRCTHESSSGQEVPILLSSRVRRVLQLIAEGRMKRLKQIVIVDSEAMAVSLSTCLRKQGLDVIHLVGDPTNSNPSRFWAHLPCVKFNHASAATIGMVCLRRFVQETKEMDPVCYASPVIQQVIVAEKPRPGYWDQIYHNVLFMLGTKRNASASVKEVFSELETRVSFTDRKEKIGRKTVNDAMRILFALGTPKEKKELRPSLCEIWDPSLWVTWENTATNQDFFWNGNEEFPSIGVTSKNSNRIQDLEFYSKFQKDAETALRLKPAFSAIPLIGYCFAVDEKIPFSATMSVAPVSAEQLGALLHPPVFQQHFAFPSYPMIPAENEQLLRYPAPSWHHVTPWSAKPPPGSFALDPLALAAAPSPGQSDLGEYQGVERSLLAWEAAELREHNADPSTVMDSFLYGIPPLEKNRFTAVPERFALTNSLCLSVSVNKSSDPTEASRKRARKRAREGEEEEKPNPESISAVIYQRIRWNWKWTRKEDEMLCALVMQFGTGWYFICSVFLLENVWRTKTRGIYQQRWRELSEHRKVVEAAVPSNLKYVCIPKRTLAAERNPFFEYSYPFLRMRNEGYFSSQFGGAMSPTEVQGVVNEAASASINGDTNGNTIPNSVPNNGSMGLNPIDSLFSAVRNKQVSSALFETPTMDETHLNELKKRDALFASFETDKMKRLQRYMRPEIPVHPSKEMVRHTSSMRSVSSLNGSGSMSTMETAGKTHGGRVSVRFFPIPKPVDFLAKRVEAIRSLPIAIMYINDPSQFQHLLGGHRHPQDGIVVPYESALAQGQRILEETTKQRAIPAELEKVEKVERTEKTEKLEMDGNRNEWETGSTTSQTKSQCPDYFDGLRDYLECMPSSPRESHQDMEVGDVGERNEMAGDVALPEAPIGEELLIEHPDETPVEKSIRQYPFIPYVTELCSQSVKRPCMEEFEECIDMKQQKIPRSSLNRMKRLIPAVAPHAFYVSVSQHTRSNNRLLQKYLSAKKKQLRNPKLFVPPLSSVARKEGVMVREVSEVNGMQGFDRQRTPQMGVGQMTMQRGTPQMNGHVQVPAQAQVQAQVQVQAQAQGQVQVQVQGMKGRNAHGMMQPNGGRSGVGGAGGGAGTGAGTRSNSGVVVEV